MTSASVAQAAEEVKVCPCLWANQYHRSVGKLLTFGVLMGPAMFHAHTAVDGVVDSGVAMSRATISRVAASMITEMRPSFVMSTVATHMLVRRIWSSKMVAIASSGTAMLRPLRAGHVTRYSSRTARRLSDVPPPAASTAGAGASEAATSSGTNGWNGHSMDVCTLRGSYSKPSPYQLRPPLSSPWPVRWLPAVMRPTAASATSKDAGVNTELTGLTGCRARHPAHTNPRCGAS